MSSPAETYTSPPAGKDDHRLNGTATFILRDNGQFLMQRRARGCGKGNWSLPGGRAEPGELILEAARREVLEETGLRVGVLTALAQTPADCPCGERWVTHWFTAPYQGGILRLSEETSEFRWATWFDLPQPLWAEHWVPLSRHLVGAGHG